MGVALANLYTEYKHLRGYLSMANCSCGAHNEQRTIVDPDGTSGYHSSWVEVARSHPERGQWYQRD